jgi:hypothetical protein
MVNVVRIAQKSNKLILFWIQKTRETNVRF